MLRDATHRLPLALHVCEALRTVASEALHGAVHVTQQRPQPGATPARVYIHIHIQPTTTAVHNILHLGSQAGAPVGVQRRGAGQIAAVQLLQVVALREGGGAHLGRCEVQGLGAPQVRTLRPPRTEPIASRVVAVGGCECLGRGVCVGGGGGGDPGETQ